MKRRKGTLKFVKERVTLGGISELPESKSIRNVQAIPF